MAMSFQIPESVFTDELLEGIERLGNRKNGHVTIESDPTGRSAKDPGAKLDSGKIMGGLLADFSLALTAVAEVGTYGANKYTRNGWESVPDAIRRYGDAKWRHLLKGATQPIDPDSGLMHKAHEAWNVLAELELMLRAPMVTDSVVPTRS